MRVQNTNLLLPKSLRMPETQWGGRRAITSGANGSLRAAVAMKHRLALRCPGLPRHRFAATLRQGCMKIARHSSTSARSQEPIQAPGLTPRLSPGVFDFPDGLRFSGPFGFGTPFRSAFHCPAMAESPLRLCCPQCSSGDSGGPIRRALSAPHSRNALAILPKAPLGSAKLDGERAVRNQFAR